MNEITLTIPNSASSNGKATIEVTVFYRYTSLDGGIDIIKVKTWNDWDIIVSDATEQHIIDKILQHDRDLHFLEQQKLATGW